MEALKVDERDTYTVTVGSKSSALEGEDTGDANVKDIAINSFSVSVGEKELVKNASLMISPRKRYGLVGGKGMGKSSLLKVLAWRKIPVLKNIDILLVEQEVSPDTDTNSAVKAVVSANEELIKCREKVKALEYSSSDDACGEEELAELYEKLHIL